MIGNEFGGGSGGLGIKTTNKTLRYLQTDIGRWSYNAMRMLDNTKWSDSKTGLAVMNGLADAFSKARIYKMATNQFLKFF
ncbi:MAG TPA: hypothetical protein PK771_10465 [Spirochaetota bacterium]|nr:hypothetical protein [Spirochaetota bacterium]